MATGKKRILHLCLSNYFASGHGYQENHLVLQHLAQGHEVLVIASRETINQQNEMVYLDAGDGVSSEGVRLTRLPYAPLIPLKLAAKLRKHSGLLAQIAAFKPDSILFHGTCGAEIVTVARYAAANPDVLFYVDSHEDWNNSARSFISREFLHRRYYGPLLRTALPHIRKILCYSTEAMDFVEELYRIPREKLELFPLGGTLVHGPEHAQRRAHTRARLGLTDGNLMFVQSGKQTVRKKLIESLTAFAALNDPDARLFISGSIAGEIADKAQALITADPRVRFVGWQDTDVLTSLLCAADIYVQPGTQSVTMQHALCCHCAVIIDDAKAHHAYFNNNGWLLNEATTLSQAMTEAIHIKKNHLQDMKNRSFDVAVHMLDYEFLSKRVLR